MTRFEMASIPAPLTWQNTPLAWHMDADDSLTMTAGEKTDWFIDPNGSSSSANAPSALFTPREQDFTLSALITVDFAATYDAGVLRIHERNDVWAKACFEYSPHGQPTIVSVVTDGYSDDCNSKEIDGNSVYLRIAKMGQAFAIHYSPDANFWHLVRYFTLGNLSDLKVGFSAQSPTGTQCKAVFSEITYRQVTLTDIRNGE